MRERGEVMTKEVFSKATIEYLKRFTQKLEEVLVSNILALEGDDFDINKLNQELLYSEQNLNKHKNYYYYRNKLIAVVDFNMFDEEGKAKGYTIYSKV